MRRVGAEIAACFRLGYRTMCKIAFVAPTRRLKMQQCWHHNRRGGESWIQDTLIDLGRDKLFRCTHCEEIWLLSQLER